MKTKTAGTWQTSIKHGKKQTKPEEVKQFWIFVGLGPERPGYYTVPGWWVENDIDSEHRKYLKAHGGHRAKTPQSSKGSGRPPIRSLNSHSHGSKRRGRINDEDFDA